MKKILLIVLTIITASVAYAAQSNITRRIYRGPESGLPKNPGMGVMMMTTDTHRPFIGYSGGKIELEKITNKGKEFGYPPLDGTKKIPAIYLSVDEQAEYDNGTCTTAMTISAAKGIRQKVKLTNAQTCSLTFTQPITGTMLIRIKIVQSASGSFNGTISGGKWPGATVPTITATSGAVDFINCYLDGTNSYCSATQDLR